MTKIWDSNSVTSNLFDLIIEKIEDGPLKGNTKNEYDLFIYNIMFRLIVYFHPFDIKLPSVNQINSDFKSYCIMLNKDGADNFLKNMPYSQTGDALTAYIHKRLYTQFQILQEIKQNI